MNKQTKTRGLLWIVVAVAPIAVLGGIAIVGNYSSDAEHVSGKSLNEIAQAGKTWNTAYTPWFGKATPDFAVEDIEGKSHRLSDYRGKNVLVVFWATWCPACNAEIPHLIELRKMLGQEELAILAISNEPPELLKQFAVAKSINYAIASADIHTLPAPFANVTSIPTTFFIDRKGTIKLATEGLVSLEETQAILQAEQ